MPAPDSVPFQSWRGSNRLGVDPGHQATQTLANLLDGMIALETLGRTKDGAVCLVFEDPFPGKLTGADLGQDLLHFDAGSLVDDARAPGVIAVFRRVGDAVPHVVETA